MYNSISCATKFKASNSVTSISPETMRELSKVCHETSERVRHSLWSYLENLEEIKSKVYIFFAICYAKRVFYEAKADLRKDYAF